MLQPGQRLQNRYLIVKMLGSGGMGAVYEADDIRLDKVCVVKEMFPPGDPVEAKVMAKQFERESKTLARLNHPNLPRVTDYFTEGGNFYLAMDLISGQSLDKQIGSQGLPEATVLQYADQLLGVLEYIHAQGILHRDIKPANIIVRPDGNCVLVDFGLVKVVGGQMSSFSMRALTPHYAPPEQYTGGTDARSDLYSLAATLYQALSGTLPAAAADQFAGQPLMSLRQLRPDVTRNTVGVIERALQLDRNKRCQTAKEMRGSLKRNAPGIVPVQRSAVLSEEPIVAAPAVYDNPTNYPDSGRLPEPETIRTGQIGKQGLPLRTQIAIGAMVFVIIVLLALVIAPALTAQQPAPTALPTRLPTWEAVNVTSITAAKPTVAPLPTTPVPIPTTPVPIPTTPVPIPTTPVPIPTTPVPIPTTPVPSVSNDLLLTLAPNVTLDLVRVPAGEFLMGSTDADTYAYPEEKPQHKVTLDEYLIGKYEVTNAQYAAYTKAKGLNWSMPQGEENHPVVYVSWDDAVAFCAWATQVTGRTVKLPTEAQWEKAARGTDGRIYPWGNEAPSSTLANFSQTMAVVGTYPSGISPYGALDMAGNVWEWTADWYSKTYYASSPSSNPQGPTTGQERVVRSGGGMGIATGVRAAIRNGNGPGAHYYLNGFRVAAYATAP